MSATKNPAFVLKTQDYRDTSVLGDFYTRDHGRIRGIVKGIRDTRARFGSTLEPFSLNEILFYKRKRGGDLHLVTQVDMADEFPSVRGDLERLGTASYCLELLSELVEPEEPEPRIFELLRDTLLFLSSGASCRRAARIFEVKLLDLLGLMPDVNHWQDVPAPANMPFSKGTLNFLEHARRQPVKSLYSVKVSQEVGEELEKVLRRFTDYHLSHKLKTLIFMEKMGY